MTHELVATAVQRLAEEKDPVTSTLLAAEIGKSFGTGELVDLLKCCNELPVIVDEENGAKPAGLPSFPLSAALSVLAAPLNFRRFEAHLIRSLLRVVAQKVQKFVGAMVLSEEQCLTSQFPFTLV